MRTLEALFLLSLWVSTCIVFGDASENGVLISAVISFALLAAHLVIEGDVWMMVPAYVSTSLLVVAYCIPGLHLYLAALIGFCASFGTILTILLPIPILPGLPENGYPVATITDCWTKTWYTRVWDRFFINEKPRELVHQRLFLKLWYPADGEHPSYKEGKRAPYMVIKGDAIFEDGDVRSRFGPFPFGQLPWLKSYANIICSHMVNRTKVNSIYGAKISDAQDKWPVVIYSHGQNATPEKNTGLIERLVSKGYVVAAYYTDDSNPNWPGDVARRQHNVRFLLERLVEINTKEDLNVGLDLLSAEKALKADLKKNPFVGKLDLDRGVGLLGHSFGATTTMLLCSIAEQNIFETHFEKGRERKLKKLKKRVVKEILEKNAKQEAEQKEKEGKTENKQNVQIEKEKDKDKDNKDKEKEKDKKEVKEEKKQKKDRQRGISTGLCSEVIPVPKIRCGIALDTWTDPVYPNSPSQPRMVTKPLLCINSDLWLSQENGLWKVKENLEAVKKGVPFYMLTMKGTSHQNFTDFCWHVASRLPFCPPSSSRWIPRHFLRERKDGMWHFGPSNPYQVWWTVDNLLEIFYDKYLQEKEEKGKGTEKETKESSKLLNLRQNDLYTVAVGFKEAN